ncbi:DUF5694 domain-containing protein [Paucibacter sp. M5-1]|uniref:DUF5694 domain-containing protein n=1 Tax=Paucibacter sp. M5-1 TaxID=3015998 RepID=UPI0022B86977|nr:DUF5694 domain-containing protein [Paucibacter sp. M5-1]MCZ7884258.1 DUF5694 domain-containing protein [Paucibacter sp. M5-1]
MSRRLRALALLAAALLLAPLPGLAEVQVMVLGSYHFANPGLDLHNAEVDDVLSARRQAELVELIERLASFRPSMVAVEARADALPGRALPGYRRYLSGEGPPDRNEIEQIGYRLARRMGLDQVLGVDAPGEFPFAALQAFAARTGRAAELQRSVDEIGARTRAFEQRARSASVATLLREINRPEAIRADHAWYVGALGYGAGSEQPGAELLGRWQARNTAICARLRQSVRPGDRVLLLFGAGHSHLLRQCVLEQSGWTLIEAEPYLR